MISILSYDFMQNAIIAGLLIGMVTPIVGIFIILRRLTFIADSLGHINMAGIAFSMLVPSVIGSIVISNTVIVIVWTILCALLIELLRNKYSEYKEISIMIVYSLSVALTMVFLSLANGYNSSVFNILFGNINAISDSDIYMMVFLITSVLIYVVFKYKKILLFALDEEHAKLYGVKVEQMKYITMVIVAIIITLAIKVVGVLLVSSLVTIPILSAANLSKSLKQTLLYAFIITEISMVIGIFLGYFLNISTSAMIVITLLLFYLVSALNKTKIR